MKKYLFLLSFLCLSTCISFAQDANDVSNHYRYWYYRYRLTNDFLVKGTADCGSAGGYSIPASKIGSKEGSDEKGWTYTNIGWGDATSYLGYYISVLATEYSLLARNNQPTSQVLEELYEAMMAYERADRSAETFLNQGSCSANDLNGFFLRDDVSQKLFDDNPSFEQKYDFTPVGNYKEYYKFNSTYIGDHSTSSYSFPSQDQVAYLFMGFALVKKCLTGVSYNGYNFSEKAKQHTKTIMTWIENCHWAGKLPDGTPYSNGSSFSEGSQWGIAKAGEAICGELHDQNMAYDINFNMGPWDINVKSYFTIVIPYHIGLNVHFKDVRTLAVAAWNDVGDILSPITDDFINTLKNNNIDVPDRPNSVGEAIMGIMYCKGKDYSSSLVQAYAAIGSSWNYGIIPICSNVQVKKSIGKCLLSGLPGMCFKTINLNCCTYNLNLPNAILPSLPLNLGVLNCVPEGIPQPKLPVIDITSNALALHGKNFNQQIYYLLHRFLHNITTREQKFLIDKDTYKNILNSAPCDLPHYQPYYDPSRRLQNTEGVAGWWASNRWVNPQTAYRQSIYMGKGIKGQTPAPFYDYGVFSGLDYMLLYNLYCLEFGGGVTYESFIDETLPNSSSLVNDLVISTQISGTNLNIRAGNSVTLRNGASINLGNTVDIKCLPVNPDLVCTSINNDPPGRRYEAVCKSALIDSSASNLVTDKVTQLLYLADSIQKAHAYVPIQDYVAGNYLKSARVDQTTKNKTQAQINLTQDNTNVIQNGTFDNFYLYPNPASDNINIVFTLLQEDLIKFNIYDISGRNIKTVVNIFPKGEYKINLDLSQLSNGIYNLKIETSRNCLNRKVIIRRNQN